jgi:hypothetical protein
MELISFENLTPEERTQAKNREAAKITLAKTEQYAKQERSIEIAKNAIKKGADNEFISEITGLTVEEIEQLRQDKD